MKTNRFLLAYLWDLSCGQRGRILLSCLIGILGTAFALGFVYTSKQLIDIATGAHAGSLTMMAAATVGLLVLQLLCGAADTWVAARMGWRPPTPCAIASSAACCAAAGMRWSSCIRVTW